MSTELFAKHLRELHRRAGKPTVRMLATSTNYGRTTINDALAGRRLPTWDVTQALVNALDGDIAEARRVWIAAQENPPNTERVPDWLMCLRADPPELAAGRGLVEVSALALRDPRAAIEDGWEVIRLSGAQLAAEHYGDIPGNWSSNIVATFRRAEVDDVLPAGMSAVAEELNRIRVHAHVTHDEAVPVATALQYVALAYRLAYEVYHVVYGDDSSSQGESARGISAPNG